MSAAWPDAELDPIRRLHVVAAGLPNVAVGEVTVDMPFDELWPWLMDLERSVPLVDSMVTDVRMTGVDRKGRTRMRARQRGVPFPVPFVVTEEDGWCVMQAVGRLFVVLMAAVPTEDGRTRYAHAEAIPLPGTRFLRPFLRWLVKGDIEGMRRNVGR